MREITDFTPYAEFRAHHTLASRNRSAVRDIQEGARLFRLAWHLGWLDIRLRYRGSMLGPFWLTLSTGIMVGALGYLYAGIFHTDLHSYFPFLSLSLVLWAFLSTLVSEACNAFTEVESLIRSSRTPYFLFAMRIVIRNLFVLAHNVVIIVAVFAIFHVWPGWHGLMALPGLLLWMVDGLALVLLLGGFCARFRDIPPIVASIMQIAFFITPVMWQPSQLGAASQAYLPLNPFFDLLEVVRQPLLGVIPTPAMWIGAGACSAALLLVGWAFFLRARPRIAFWV